MKIYEGIYVALFFLTIWTIIIIRIILIVKLYPYSKTGKLFSKNWVGEVISALASLTIPFKIDCPNKIDPEAQKITNRLNKLKNYYWITMASLLFFIIALNIVDLINFL